MFVPNRQDEIKKFHEYGFEPKEIAEKLDIDVKLVESAIEDIPGDTRLWRPAPLGEDAYEYFSDNTIPAFELLYEYGPAKLNKWLDELGFTGTAKKLGTRVQDLYVLKRHFSYYKPLPPDAKEHVLYFPEIIREKIKNLDKSTCQRCGEVLGNGEVEFHRIDPYGPTVWQNCIIICRHCHVAIEWGIENEAFGYDPDGHRREDFYAWVKAHPPRRGSQHTDDTS